MNSKSISDAILVSQYIKGDEPSLSMLIKRHQQRLYSFIYSKVYDRDVTEDVFQDTFIKVIRTLKRGNYNEEGKFLPWVMRIAHNLVIDHFRKNNRMPKFNNSGDFDIFSVLSDGALNAEGELVKSQIVQDIRALVEELPEEQKISSCDAYVQRYEFQGNFRKYGGEYQYGFGTDALCLDQSS